MPVPNIFGSATSAIPLSQLDQNFATAITLGNTAVYLGNTTTSLGNVTLTNVTISSGNVTLTGANVSGTANVSTLVVTGNQNFAGTGNRITGDFSNATVANRVAFQTSTTNASTAVSVIPNGTNNASLISFTNASDPDNASFNYVGTVSSEFRLAASKNGTGSYQPVVIQTGGSERVRVDTSGNVGIGTSSPQGRLHISGGYTGFEYNSGGAYPSYNTYFGAIGSNFQVGSSYLDFWNTVGAGFQWHIQTAASTQTSVMTIDSSGNLLVGTTSNSGNQRLVVQAVGGLGACGIKVSVNGSGGIDWYNASNTYLASVNVGATTITYNTSSDYRLKENVAPMTGALAKVQLLKPVTYNWKVDGSSGQGFIAHELQEVYPDAVTGEKDGEQMQGVDYGKLTPILTAALQEAIAKIETLEARIAVLEAK